VSRLQCAEDFSNDVISATKHIVVPKSQNSETAPKELFVAFPIDCVVVPSAIDLNDQHAFQTGEISYIGSDGMLTPESTVCQLPAPEGLPKMLLSFGHASAQPPCKFPFFTVAQDSPPSQPSPASGGRGSACGVWDTSMRLHIGRRKSP
jgi:hypothetical protein